VMISWLFFVVSLIGGWLTLNVYRPHYASGRLAILSFFTGWLTAELALHHIAWQVLVTLFFVWKGALGHLPGTIALWISIASWIGLAAAYFGGASGARVVEAALADGFGGDYRKELRPELASRLRDWVEWREIARPFPMRHPDVERVRDIQFARVRGVNLKLDVYRHRSHPENCPVLFEIHGGGWIVGSKNEQGIPMMLRMAAQGWVCVSADYRLSPHATFPDHLVDLKRALAWIREHVREYGGNPDFVVAAGQSAGGHLASLVSLTANRAEYQPGLEEVDTSVAGCVSFYGVYDFTDRHKFWPNPELARLLEEKVIKASLDEDREAYESASPMSRIHPEAPPFFVIHGNRDTLVPVAEARRFAEDLRAVSKAKVVYAEIPGAQHAFELFPSLRGELVLAGVERFLVLLYSRYLAAHVDRAAASAAG
jgi:acetyl esterase/lipase